MTRRKLRVPDLPTDAIGAYRCLDDYEYDYRKTYGDTPMATRMDIPPAGGAKVKWILDKVFFKTRELR